MPLTGSRSSFRHLVNLLLWIAPPTRLFAMRRALLRLAGVDIASSACVGGRGWIYGRGSLRIGARSWLSPEVTVFTHVDAQVVICEDCDVGPGVRLVTGSHEIGGAVRRAGAGTAKPIYIGRGCWIGAYSTILGGVSIGDGAIVAAGAMVTKDIPAHSMCAGIPAVVKKSLPT